MTTWILQGGRGHCSQVAPHPTGFGAKGTDPVCHCPDLCTLHLSALLRRKGDVWENLGDDWCPRFQSHFYWSASLSNSFDNGQLSTSKYGLGTLKFPVDKWCSHVLELSSDPWLSTHVSKVLCWSTASALGPEHPSSFTCWVESYLSVGTHCLDQSWHMTIINHYFPMFYPIIVTCYPSLWMVYIGPARHRRCEWHSCVPLRSNWLNEKPSPWWSSALVHWFWGFTFSWMYHGGIA